MLPYDKTSPSSIESYAKKLIGKTFKEAIGGDIVKKGKGGLGQLIEKYYFMYEINSDSEPDFKEAGVELKSTPYKILENKKKVAKERLVLHIINYMEVHKETFATSHFLHKNKLLLLVYYLFDKDKDKLDYCIDYAQLFSFPEKDLKIIEDDWNKILDKIRQGKAHEISESDTNYLAACPKGSSKESVRRQPFSDVMAMQRAFSLKGSYMTHILNEYLVKGVVTYHSPENTDGRVAEGIPAYGNYDDSVVKDIMELKEKTFEELVMDKINRFKGKSISELANIFNITTNPRGKSYTWDVAKALLGVKGNLIEEFEKANIKVKTIRLESDGSIREHMSFPTFRYKDIIQEDWETSELREMFLDTRFLFFIYKKDELGNLVLEKGMFWNMPTYDLEGDVSEVWYETVGRIRDGRADDLPRSVDNPILHVRPHAQNSNDTYETPDGRWFVKKCFWLHREYIRKQIFGN